MLVSVNRYVWDFAFSLWKGQSLLIRAVKVVMLFLEIFSPHNVIFTGKKKIVKCKNISGG